ncbi:MAG: DUF1566 domain-containing protein [Nitrospirae bacterium]|nr:DUF1566 domain-containing protein [Nitrospirota bacterium]
MKLICVFSCAFFLHILTPIEAAIVFKAVDTGQNICYGNLGPITCPSYGSSFYGQDAQYDSTVPYYTFNDNLTVVIDQNTGLMWERAHHSSKVDYNTANGYCDNLTLGGYTDWRVPTIKELFSISDSRGATHKRFYIDTNYFDLEIPTEGELTGTHTYDMMGQTWSSTLRPDKVNTVYFYNFLDGHIKSNGTDGTFENFYRCARGTSGVFENSFVNNGNGTITDRATGLLWQQTNGAKSTNSYQFTWKDALNYCDNLTLGGISNWRLPNVKELQSIVDYSNTNPAIDTNYFQINQTTGSSLFFWSSTTTGEHTEYADYVCFGPCSSVTGADIHGPGAQRSDPKYDDGTDYSAGIGDQNDLVQINNYVRCVFSNASTSDYDSALTEINTLYLRNAAYFGEKSGVVQIGTSSDTVYYIQWYANGTALIAWTDGYMYYYDGTNTYYANVNWKTAADCSRAETALNALYNQNTSTYGTRSGSVLQESGNLGYYYVQKFKDGTSIVAWPDGFLYYFDGSTMTATGGYWK